MRIPFYPVSRGSSLETARVLANSNLVLRFLAIGVPSMAICLCITFGLLVFSAERALERAKARNTQLRAQGMTLVLEQIFTDTRNQLLILSAGDISRDHMMERLRFRAQAGGVRYREIALIAKNPEDSFLLLNYQDKIVSVPVELAREALGSPFNGGEVQHTQNRVHMSQPTEAVYPPLRIGETLQSPRLQVVRFSCPVYHANGDYEGVLILSLDISILRDAISQLSLLSVSGSPLDNETIRAVFFDAQGWMIFQAEEEAASPQGSQIGVDEFRKGFSGDFGRPGFSTAFRPYPDNLYWWTAVAAVQKGEAGRIEINSDLQGSSSRQGGFVSYAPLRFSETPESKSIVVGGLAVLDSPAKNFNIDDRLWEIALAGFTLSLVLASLIFWKTGNSLRRSLTRLTAEITQRNEEERADSLPSRSDTAEMRRLTFSINGILRRLRMAERDQNSWKTQQRQLWEKEACDWEDLPLHPGPLGLVGNSETMIALRDTILRVASTDADVLVIGETGTGKELVSRAIHEASARKSGPFITINCGALDENLLMDTLFGHVKGAYTEARQSRKGAFLAAEGGTLMLDEIGNASPKVQQALLRSLSMRTIRPLGSDEEIPFNTRIVAATNAVLSQDENFREDLYYRLAVLTIKTPPLRERLEDIPALALFFLSQEAIAREVPLPRLSRGALERLSRWAWPGNVRELRNCLIRAMAFCENGLIQAENIQLAPLSNEEETYGNSTGTTVKAVSESPSREEQVKEPLQQQEESLPPRLADTLPKMLASGSVSRQEYQKLAGNDISMRTAQYDLQLLQRMGLVCKRGRGPAQVYELTEAGRQYVEEQKNQTFSL